MRHSNLHTHTTFSDGKNTPREMVLVAIEQNLSSLGFSDHSVTPFDPSYAMAWETYPEYVREISELKKEFASQIPLYCGIEQDYFSPECPFQADYIIGSVHYIYAWGDYFAIDHSKKEQLRFLESCGKNDPNELARYYFDLVAKMAQRKNFDILGHFDVLNKFGLFDEPDEVYLSLAREALDEVLLNIPLIEVNTGAIARGHRKDPYPDARFIPYIREKGGKFVISGDTHKTEDLLTYYDSAALLLKEQGFSAIWQKDGAAWKEVPLSMEE